MNHTFSCGIIGTSYDGAGDEFLRGMMTDYRRYDFPGIRNLPPQFTIRVHEFDALWTNPELLEKMRQLNNAMIARGYEIIESRNNFDFVRVIHYRWQRP